MGVQVLVKIQICLTDQYLENFCKKMKMLNGINSQLI